MASINVLKTDSKRETEGVPFEYAKGLVFTVRRIPNKAYDTELQALLRRRKRLLKKRSYGVEEMRILEECTFEAAAKHVLVGWTGLTESDAPDAPEIPFSQEKALELMLSPDFRDFANDLVKFASDPDNFRDDSGN